MSDVRVNLLITSRLRSHRLIDRSSLRQREFVVNLSVQPEESNESLDRNEVNHCNASSTETQSAQSSNALAYWPDIDVP